MIFKVDAEGHLHEEESHEGGFLTEYKEVLSDPAHLAAEVTNEIVSYLIFGVIFAKIWARHDRKHHKGHTSREDH